jgi:hypothetical protein
MEPDWQAIAQDLAETLQSFVGYDSYGEGGADDANRGDCDKAYLALGKYFSESNS